MIEKFRCAVILRIHSINGDLNKKRFVFLIKIVCCFYDYDIRNPLKISDAVITIFFIAM